MTTSYLCKRFSTNGIEYLIQINLKDDTMTRRKYFCHETINVQNNKLIKLTSHYNKDYTLASFISGEPFSFDFDIGMSESFDNLDTLPCDMNSNELLHSKDTTNDNGVTYTLDTTYSFGIIKSQKRDKNHQTLSV